MFTYKELERSSPSEAHPELVIKKLEVELLKFALNKIFSEQIFDKIEVENLRWQLKQLFSFEIKVDEISLNTFKFYLKNGDEIISLDLNINIK
ncbi:MAG: hypothetical protein ABIP51_18035 [Bacteroidia bacterium]